MREAEELYSKTVSRLTPKERLRLAVLILNGIMDGQVQLAAPILKLALASLEEFLAKVHKEKEAGRPVVDLLDGLPAGGRLLKTPAEADAYLREERDSWDR